jgi:hypothetical protein
VAVTDDDERFGAFSIEELADYLDAGRSPVRPDIESDPVAMAALGRIASLRGASRELLDAEVEADRAGDEGWIATVLASVRTTAHAGRDIPVPDPDPSATLVVTEGALRGLVRTLGDQEPGVVVRRTRFTGALGVPGGSVDVEVTVALTAEASVHGRAETFRTVVIDALREHAPFTLASVVVRVVDVLVDGDRSGSGPRSAR